MAIYAANRSLTKFSLHNKESHNLFLLNERFKTSASALGAISAGLKHDNIILVYSLCLVYKTYEKTF